MIGHNWGMHNAKPAPKINVILGTAKLGFIEPLAVDCTTDCRYHHRMLEAL